MKEKLIKAITLLCLITLMCTGCKKEVKGPKGDPGQNGTNGVASITTTTLNATSWTWDSSSKWRYADFINVAVLSQANIDKAMIMVYENQSGIQVPLPYNVTISPTVSANMLYAFGLNSISLYCFYSNETDPNPPPTVFRLVVIPQSMIKPNVNYNNYNEVLKAHSLDN